MDADAHDFSACGHSADQAVLAEHATNLVEHVCGRGEVGLVSDPLVASVKEVARAVLDRCTELFPTELIRLESGGGVGVFVARGPLFSAWMMAFRASSCSVMSKSPMISYAS